MGHDRDVSRPFRATSVRAELTLLAHNGIIASMPLALETLALIAEDHDGVIPAAAARRAGISANTLVKLATRGRLQRVARGVYKLPIYPQSRARYAQFHEALALLSASKGPRAAISHESALEVWGLSDASSTKVHATIPPTVRLRRDVPPWMKVHRADLLDDEVEQSHGLLVTSVERTISDMIEIGRHDLGLQAVRDALASGILTKARANRLIRSRAI